mmetsp:Transcript_38153/g.88150  ORF Transcript_38153/g.88150 Transcript_38153/m.88150 type:complete len:312 (+) Transcript_38153:1875-2810(+)
MASPKPPVLDHGATSAVTKTNWYFLPMVAAGLLPLVATAGSAPRSTARPTATAAGPDFGAPRGSDPAPLCVRACAGPALFNPLGNGAEAGGRPWLASVGARDTSSTALGGVGFWTLLACSFWFVPASRRVLPVICAAIWRGAGALGADDATMVVEGMAGTADGLSLLVMPAVPTIEGEGVAAGIGLPVELPPVLVVEEEPPLLEAVLAVAAVTADDAGAAGLAPADDAGAAAAGAAAAAAGAAAAVAGASAKAGVAAGLGVSVLTAVHADLAAEAGLGASAAGALGVSTAGAAEVAALGMLEVLLCAISGY